ncbi:MAG: hypothetical protein ABSB49_19530 [Polyangia bacterium]|jgi:hypothetical protein
MVTAVASDAKAPTTIDQPSRFGLMAKVHQFDLTGRRDDATVLQATVFIAAKCLARNLL